MMTFFCFSNFRRSFSENHTHAFKLFELKVRHFLFSWISAGSRLCSIQMKLIIICWLKGINNDGLEQIKCRELASHINLTKCLHTCCAQSAIILAVFSNLNMDSHNFLAYLIAPSVATSCFNAKAIDDRL